MTQLINLPHICRFTEQQPFQICHIHSEQKKVKVVMINDAVNLLAHYMMVLFIKLVSFRLNYLHFVVLLEM